MTLEMLTREFRDRLNEEFKDSIRFTMQDSKDIIATLCGMFSEELIEEGKEVTPETSASDLCEMLKAKFNGGYTFAEGATGSNITWHESGKVNKIATKYTLKEAN